MYVRGLLLFLSRERGKEEGGRPRYSCSSGRSRKLGCPTCAQVRPEKYPILGHFQTCVFAQTQKPWFFFFLVMVAAVGRLLLVMATRGKIEQKQICPTYGDSWLLCKLENELGHFSPFWPFPFLQKEAVSGVTNGSGVEKRSTGLMGIDFFILTKSFSKVLFRCYAKTARDGH